jgi:hypothetical protein
MTGRFASKQNAPINSVAICRRHNRYDAFAALVGLAPFVARPDSPLTACHVFAAGFFLVNRFRGGRHRDAPICPIRQQFRPA